MRMRHERALAGAIAADSGSPGAGPARAALARLTFEARAPGGTASYRVTAVDAVFDLLERGWERARPGAGPTTRPRRPPVGPRGAAL
ncbi:hypothetical protein [Streptomyces sp. NPDC051452]|uniref:hypothetical protein n=1 Tax=Streptomyces sp. NPDC051452 TaxID=3365654 RepID=UPI00379C78B7